MAGDRPSGGAKRRGAKVNPPNRFEPTFSVPDFEHREFDEELLGPLPILPTDFIPDQTASIVTKNDSPDVFFRQSLNPYRGCEHGCVYCYARPSHEYLGMNAGLDFETKIMVKHRAPELLRQFLARPGYQCEPIVLSGVTDCYQPVERKLGLTRGCLEVMRDVGHPVGIVTKNRLVVRDLDILSELAHRRLAAVNISLTTLDPALAREMEPRTGLPARRLEAIRLLSEAGVPVRVLVAPLIPGLNDSEVPAILEAAKTAGAQAASYVLLRLPHSVRPIFLDWLAKVFPERAPRVVGRIRATRGGKLSDPNFGSRMRGTGEMAEQIRTMFRLFASRHGLDGPTPDLDTSQFVPPVADGAQLRLF